MSSSAPDVVKMTTGMDFSLGSALISSRTCQPPFLGRFKSNRMRSGCGALACLPCRFRKSVASIPSEATCRLFRTLASRRASLVSRTSPGLSSTKRISMGVAAVSLIFMVLSPFRESEIEGRAFSGIRVHPHPAAVAFRDLLAQCQADSGAGKLFSAVQALKHDENLLEILRLDSKPIVLHGEDPFVVAIFLGGDVDARRFRAAVFEGVADDVL